MMKPCTGLASAKLCPQCQSEWTGCPNADKIAPKYDMIQYIQSRNSDVCVCFRDSVAIFLRHLQEINDMDQSN